MIPIAVMMINVPSVRYSKVALGTPHESLNPYSTPKIFSSTSGNTASNTPSAIQNVVRIVEIQRPVIPHGCTYGRGTCGCDFRSLSTDGKIQRYEMSVVEIAMSRTTWNFALCPPLNAPIATKQNTVAVIPESTLTRTGVPSLLLKTPKNGKKAPSYAATAWMRSDPIIHTAPDVTIAAMKQSVMITSSACAAPPYTPLNVSVTASMKPPMPVTFESGSTRMMQPTGMMYMSTPAMPLLRIETGTSRCGFSISSAAPFCSSKPT